MKSPTKLLLISFIFIGMYSCDCFAQSSRFNIGLVAGLNFSELEGDEITDYLGLNAGLLGTAKLSNTQKLEYEIFYNKNSLVRFC